MMERYGFWIGAASWLLLALAADAQAEGFARAQGDIGSYQTADNLVTDSGERAASASYAESDGTNAGRASASVSDATIKVYARSYSPNTNEIVSMGAFATWGDWITLDATGVDATTLATYGGAPLVIKYRVTGSLDWRRIGTGNINVSDVARYEYQFGGVLDKSQAEIKGDNGGPMVFDDLLTATFPRLSDGYFFRVSATASSVAYNAETICDFESTGRLESITFEDGSTPEELGFRIVFESGMASPNNVSPVADAGEDITAECAGPGGTLVVLDASGSSDADDDDLSYQWSVPEGSGATLDDATTATPTGTFAPGPTLVTLTVTDGNGGIDVDDVLVTVSDTTAPVLLCTTDLVALWPPKRQLVPVEIRVLASDVCSSASDLVVSCTVSSDEPDAGGGESDVPGDVDGEDGYTSPVAVSLSYDATTESYSGTVLLRAERLASGDGRTYSIVCEVLDGSGNLGTASCAVVVPHDRRKEK